MFANKLPPFPDNVPILDLPTIDYALIRVRDQNEISRLWTAATELGFWYLRNHSADALFEPMFEMGRKTMSLPIEEKMKCWQGKDGGSFGYKSAGATYVDLNGSRDKAEFINVSKDDALSYPRISHIGYPSTVNSDMEDTVKPFVRKIMEINDNILDVFNEKLGLPEGVLRERHSTEEASISEARVIKVPASPGSTDAIAVGAHTDFGSLSFLVNELGGLQLLPLGQTDWKYVKPFPDHVICNIGDALNLFSGGILKSSIHRVLSPPLDQSNFDRWSLVYFTRPGNSVLLKALADESLLIAKSVGIAEDPSKNDPGVTAEQWFIRRQSKWRAESQRVRVTDYLASRGTEHIQAAI